MDEYGRRAYAAGFRGKGLSTAISVGYAETRGNPDQVGRKGELGPWQIYPKAHPDWAAGNLRDYDYNARAAFSISAGGTNWRPWSTWPAASMLWLPQAEVAAQRVEHLGGIGALPAEAGTHVPGLGSGAENLGQNLNPFSSITDAIKFLSIGRNWGRIGQILIGGVIVLIAVNTLTKPYTEPARKFASSTAKATPAGEALGAFAAWK
jgi:hypothetical protein